MSQSVSGLRGAVPSGVAVIVEMTNGIVGVMRELTAENGLPELERLPVRLERAHLEKSAILDRLEGHLLLRLAETA